MVCISAFVLGAVTPDYGQYFGKNKARYRTFDFEVVQSPHFEFYHYTNDSSINHLIDLSERWYRIHQTTFKDTIRFKNPVIFYNNHAEFQQTATIGGIIGVGTGGVTEGLKNRVVMPMMETWAQTDHVLGHELVHAFQYNLLRNENDTLSLKNMQSVPLWMIEGLAEYLSIGRKDPHTAMWMRDAVLNDDIPSLKDLTTSSKYFPYRYGHAFWAFIGGVWGDSTAIELYKNVVRFGPDAGIDSTLSMNSKALSVLWEQGVKNYYMKFLKDSTDQLTGELLVDENWGGYINISPSISPNGRYVAFLSEKNLFGIDLYLADLETGKILRKISSSTGRNAHIDALSFIESSGTWSPDGGSYAYVVFDKGKNMLMVTDLWSGRNEQKIEIPGVESISNPSWSPWGNKIVFTGIKNGRSDLFLYDLGSGAVEQLTDDPYSDIQPSWSPDGRYLVFSTDRKSFEQHGNMYSFNLSIIDLLSGTITNLPVFPGADNLNPRYANLNDLVFVSNRDGYRNLYEYDISNNQVHQLTDYITGISGITPFAPAIDVSSKNEKVVYTYYSKGKYSIYSAPLEDFNRIPLRLNDIDMTPAYLVPGTQNQAGMMVQKTIDSINQYEKTPADSLSSKPYRGKFKLDYVGNTGVGVAYGSYGLGMAGGVNMLFGDMLGNNQLFAALMVNGEVYDFGGQVAYFNQKKRLGWGASISHIPYRLDYIGFGLEELPVSQDSTIVVENWSRQVVRIFEDQASLFAYYPFSTTRRVEWSGSYSHYSYRIDQFNNYYYRGWYIGESREKLDAPDPYGLLRTSVAYVGDNASFGIASPMKGHRFRLDFTQYGGELHYNGLLADIRQYFYLKPFSLAFRGYFYGRYGRDITSNRLSPLFVGHSMLVRGYDDVMFSNSFVDPQGINQLYGNKILVGNFELRFPLTGPKRLTPFESKFLFTEIAFFVDAGTTWDTPPAFSGIETGNGNDRPFSDFIISSGISTRINLFGQVILEPYYAVPYQRTDLNGKRGVIGLNFWPGW